MIRELLLSGALAATMQTAYQAQGPTIGRNERPYEPMRHAPAPYSAPRDYAVLPTLPRFYLERARQHKA